MESFLFGKERIMKLRVNNYLTKCTKDEKKFKSFTAIDNTFEKIRREKT